MSYFKKGRRDFLKTAGMAGAGTLISVGNAPDIFSFENQTPAVLGGLPVRTHGWPKWPIWNIEKDEPLVIEALRSGVWSRAKKVDLFEEEWAKAIGCKRALATVNGTSALITALMQLDIGGGDEVILPPYTFIATLSAILATGAMPVFADIDQETFLINPDKISSKITSRTRAILPVHICGLPADMEAIMPIAEKNKLVVVEDACQAWYAEIKGKKVGGFGNAGCFSFQNSKNIPIGEGGAIVSDDDAFMDRCTSYHNLGLPYGSAGARPGVKFRLTEYQAAIGLAQLKRLESQTETRNTNALYLSKKLKDIPGIIPHRLYDNVTRAAYHLFPFRYKKEQFSGLAKDGFLKALRAEGIPCSGGYTPLNTLANLGNTFETKNYKRMYDDVTLNPQKWLENNACPENDMLCTEAVWIPQNVLLGTKTDMEDIVSAIEKIQKNSGKINEKTK